MMSETTRKAIAWFKVNPQVRLDLGSEADLRNLGESLRKRQLSPVGAMADGELIYGFRRLKAASLVGLSDLLVTIYDERLTPAEIKSIQITENIHRLDMKPFEKWRAYEDLRSLHPQWTARDLAEHVKLDPSAVTKWLSPSRCIPAWQEALKAGLVGITDCYAAAQATSEQQQQEMLAMKLAGASRDALSKTVRRAKPTDADNSVRLGRITIPLPSGSKVVVSGKNLSLSEVVETLKECLDAAKKGEKEKLDAKTWQNVMRDKSLAVNGGDDDV